MPDDEQKQVLSEVKAKEIKMAKTIAITTANKAVIEAALVAVNGRATAHTYTSFEEVAEIAEAAEAAIAALNLPKADRVGAVWFETSGAAVAKAYRQPRIATALKIIRKASGWHLASVSDAQIWEKGGGKGRLYLTEAQAADAKARFAASLNVLKAAE